MLWLAQYKTHTQKVRQAETSWPLPSRWANPEGAASYFHFSHKQQLERKAETWVAISHGLSRNGKS